MTTTTRTRRPLQAVTRSTVGRCVDRPRYVSTAAPMSDADDAARAAAGWTTHGHRYARTTGRPGAYVVAVPCNYSSDDAAAWAAHMRDVHGDRPATVATVASLTGRGFRSTPATVSEKLTLGRPVTITRPDGTTVAGQVWSDADPTLVGTRKGGAVFLVDVDRRAYVVAVDTKRHRGTWYGYAMTTAGGHDGRITAQLEHGPAADETPLELEAPAPAPAVSTPAPAATVDTTPPAPVAVDYVPGVPFPAAATAAGVPESDWTADAVTAYVNRGRELSTTPTPELSDVDVSTVLGVSPVDVAGMIGARHTHTADPELSYPAARAARRDARRALAAALRDAGIAPAGDAWTAAAAAAGIAPVATVVGA